MPTTATKQGISLPTYGDPPAIPADLLSLWNNMISRGIPRYASTTQRDAEWPSPTAGQFAITTDTMTVWFYTTSWVKLFQTSGVARREVLTGTDVITAAAGVTFGNRLAVIDHGSDGSKLVSLGIEATNAPYTAGTGSANWGTVGSSIVPPRRTPVQFAHSSNMGMGQIDTAGLMRFLWGTFGASGSTSIAASATYVIPAA